MKHFKWLLIGFAFLCLAVLPLAGCVSKSEYEALQADYDELNAELQSVKAELAQIKEVYPPEDFPSLTALNDWLLENDVSEKPATTYANDWYGRALEVQEDAIKDGYIVSVDYDYDEEGEKAFVWCVAVINGRVFYWDPETDEILEDEAMGTVK